MHISHIILGLCVSACYQEKLHSIRIVLGCGYQESCIAILPDDHRKDDAQARDHFSMFFLNADKHNNFGGA